MCLVENQAKIYKSYQGLELVKDIKKTQMTISIFSVTEKGAKVAGKLSDKLDSCVLLERDEISKFGLAMLVKKAFERDKGLIFVMATGIVVRAIAPLLRGKAEDPAVVVVDEGAKYAISLLSGHLGGANALARKVARLIRAEPVITTATDVNGLTCIEEIAGEFNMVFEDIGGIKHVNSAIVNGGKVAFIDEDVNRLTAIKGFLDQSRLSMIPCQGSGSTKRKSTAQRYRFFKTLPLAGRFKADVSVVVTHRLLPDRPSATKNVLVMRPKDLVVGIGCNRGVSILEIENAYQIVLNDNGISPQSVRNLATIDVKCDEKGLLAFADKNELYIGFYTKDDLKDIQVPSGPSKIVMEKVGVGGVCEPAALRSAGMDKIWIKKKRIGRVTIAVAMAPFIL